MRYFALLSILIMASSVTAQDRPKYETVPDYTVLVAIASQANCPLRIEDASFLKRADATGVLIKYRLRNISNKPIWFVSVVLQNWSGTSENFMPMPRVKKILLPNETLESATVGVDYDVVGQYKPANEGQKSPDGMKTLYVLLVDKVNFTDGSTYEDPKTLSALLQFFEKKQ